jgi:dephospho-CoA kinase
MVLGLTGRYCAGKDAVARILERRGFRVLDVDRIGHEVLEERREEVAAAFGPGVRRADGSIDRRALGRIVFADPDALARHEAIMHPAMVERVRALTAAERGAGRDVAVNAALLRRMGLDRLCDAVLEVRACFPRRFLRGLRRDRLGPVQVLRRMRSQHGGPRRLNSKTPGVDTYTVRNDRATSRRLEHSVDRIVDRLRHRQA